MSDIPWNSYRTRTATLWLAALVAFALVAMAAQSFALDS